MYEVDENGRGIFVGKSRDNGAEERTGVALGGAAFIVSRGPRKPRARNSTINNDARLLPKTAYPARDARATIRNNKTPKAVPFPGRHVSSYAQAPARFGRLSA